MYPLNYVASVAVRLHTLVRAQLSLSPDNIFITCILRRALDVDDLAARVGKVLGIPFWQALDGASAGAASVSGFLVSARERRCDWPCFCWLLCGSVS